METTTKRTYTRLDFTLEDEEQLIDFVKSNPALYDPKSPHFKNKMYRDRLWLEFGNKIQKSGKLFYFVYGNEFRSCIFFIIFQKGTDCSKKWSNIRDMYNRNKGKKLGSGSSAESKRKRNEQLSFLEEICTVNRRFVA